MGSNYTYQIGLKISSLKKDIYPLYFSYVRLNHSLISIINGFESDVRLVLITNASRRSVLQILKYFKLSKMFNFIITSEDVTEPKPSPEGYLLGLKKLGVSSENCVAIEDSLIGVSAAKSAKIKVLKVTLFE
jgi:HAD superfamily hydrolase (TIGR01509 family)